VKKEGPQAMYAILPAALRERISPWKREFVSLKCTELVSPGFFDCADGKVTVCFLQITNLRHTGRAQLPPWVIDEAVRIVEEAIRKALRSTGGYQIPRRNGWVMFVFHTPADCVRCFLMLQWLLLAVAWPNELLEARHLSAENDAEGETVLRGLRLGGGACIGTLRKMLEANGTADYQGPAANRAARLCTQAPGGQLWMFAEQFEELEPALEELKPFAHSDKGYATLKGYGTARVHAISHARAALERAVSSSSIASNNSSFYDPAFRLDVESPGWLKLRSTLERGLLRQGPAAALKRAAVGLVNQAAKAKADSRKEKDKHPKLEPIQDPEEE